MMRARVRALSDDNLRRLLTDHQLRVTEQRLLLLRELSKHVTPLSHAELTERLAGTNLDRATIYRNLLSLTENGILVRTQLGDHVSRYELPRSIDSDHTHHAHLICSDCGAVKCLPLTAVTFHGEAAHSQIDEIELRGRCAHCSRS